MKIPNFKDLILFENEDFIVINKPPYIASLDQRNSEAEPNILRLAKAYFPDAQIGHRLDKETSGCMVIAKNPEAYRHISMQFEHRQVDKIYHALVEGNQPFKDFLVDLPILNAGNKNVIIDRYAGKKAETIFNAIQFFKHYTLVACKPITGRMHQIRIHLATQRAPIVGDEMYKGNDVYLSKIKRGYRLPKDEVEQPLIKRFALHARHVSFDLMNGERITVEAPYPKDYEVLLKLLEKHDKTSFSSL